MGCLGVGAEPPGRGRAQREPPAAARGWRELPMAAAPRIAAGAEQLLLPEENGAAGKLPVSGRAVLTHGERSGLCPRRGCERAGVAAQEGLPERGGDPASIWSRKIKVTGGASGSWGKARACRRRRGKAHPLSAAGRPGEAPVFWWGPLGLPRSRFTPT